MAPSSSGLGPGDPSPACHGQRLTAVEPRRARCGCQQLSRTAEPSPGRPALRSGIVGGSRRSFQVFVHRIRHAIHLEKTCLCVCVGMFSGGGILIPSVYTAVAKQEKTTVDKVGEIRAKQIRSKANEGDFIQEEDGKWVKAPKPAPKDEKKDEKKDK